MIYLRIAPGCISCIDSGHSCSFVPFIGDGKTHVHVPYSIVIGKIFHCRQISLWMQGSPMEIQPRRIENIHFGQGMPHGVKAHHFNKQRLADEKKRVKIIQKDMEEEHWQFFWYGLSYQDAEQAYRFLMSKDPEEIALVENAQWDITDSLTEHDLELVDQYYERLTRVWPNDDFVAYDMLDLIPLIPHLVPLLPTGQNPELRAPPQSYGTTKEQWMEEMKQELGLIDGPEEEGDVESELEELQQDGEVEGDAHDDDDDVEEAEHLEDSTFGSSGNHTEEEVDEIVEDEEGFGVDEPHSAQESPVVIERQASSGRGSIYDMPTRVDGTSPLIVLLIVQGILSSVYSSRTQ